MGYKAVVFDIDGTITSHISSWQYLHERLGNWNGKAELYQEQYLSGKISYKRFCELDAAEWKGLEENTVTDMFLEVPYAQNAPHGLRKLKRSGFKLAAVSTGLQYIPERIKSEFSFDYMIYNRLLSQDGILTGRVQINISQEEKGAALEKILRKMNLSGDEVIGIGDSSGDMPMAEICGYFIAFNSSCQDLSKAADYVCRTKDFSEALEAVMLASGLTPPR